METTTKLFKAALADATCSRRDLAKEAGYSIHTFARYASDIQPSADAALALAHTLEKRATRLRILAAELREAVLNEQRRAPVPKARSRAD